MAPMNATGIAQKIKSAAVAAYDIAIPNLRLIRVEIKVGPNDIRGRNFNVAFAHPVGLVNGGGGGEEGSQRRIFLLLRMYGGVQKDEGKSSSSH